MVHTLSLILAMATIAEPFPHIAAQLPARRLAMDSRAVLALSAVADVANRLEVCLNLKRAVRSSGGPLSL
jgi:hypothetical protein